MHTMHLGIFQYMYGSVLWLLTYVVLPGNPQQHMKTIWASLRAYWRLHPTPGRYQSMRPSMFERADHQFPHLKGQAGEIKRLSGGLLAVWDRFCENDDCRVNFIVHQQIKLMIQWFITLDSILDRHPPQESPALPAREANEFEQKCFEVLAVIKFINRHYATHPVIIPGKSVAKPFFNVTIKCHSLTHIAKSAQYINPRLGICYSGEDYMHQCKKLVQSAVRVTQLSVAGRNFARRYARRCTLTSLGIGG